MMLNIISQLFIILKNLLRNVKQLYIKFKQNICFFFFFEDFDQKKLLKAQKILEQEINLKLK
ncbi:hypothetical protein pb186bvf_007246 [Paramecium bursaria]